MQDAPTNPRPMPVCSEVQSAKYIPCLKNEKCMMWKNGLDGCDDTCIFTPKCWLGLEHWVHQLHT